MITAALGGQFNGEGASAHVLPILSDDRTAQMFGSAPSEAFTGGAAIKQVFKRWSIDLYADRGEHTRAGIVHQHYSTSISPP